MTDETKTTTPEGAYPNDLPVVPLREAVVFPKLVVPLGVGREKSVAAINAAMAEERHLIVLVAQRDAEIDDVQPEQIYNVGTVAEIVRLLRIPDGSAQIIVQGLQRVKITGYAKEERYFRVTFDPIVEELGDAVEREAQLRNVKALFDRYVDNGGAILPELAMTAKNTDDPAHFADLVASSPDLTLEQRQQLLEQRSVIERLKVLSVFLAKQNEILELKQKIQSEVQQTLDKTQREYILREQMKAIQKELGDDDQTSELKEIREKIEQAGMPDLVKEKALKEVGRLEKIPQASPETGVIRTYVDWLVSLPWKVAANDDWDIAQAAKILDEDHYGLPKVKDRIIEYMAVRKLSQNLRAPILCFVGPPGVGKTSLGKSIARAMGRKFIRMSLGGIRDEAEIRGHRRTYVGALPGRILQNMKTAAEVNPVFMLDEIDKVGADFRGDPSAALLEVLDPEQNYAFSDHYLEIPYDLSKVIFLTTANVLHPIPAALRDRLEIIELPGYTKEEKLHIARQFLIPKQMSEHGVEPSRSEIHDEAVRRIIREYTFEAGVRNLEREIAAVMRKVARKVVEGRRTKAKVTAEKIPDYLGPQKQFYGQAEEEDEVGVATGVAWTSAGGDLTTVEATLMDGRGNLTLTGQLGDVMKESAQAALSYARSRAGQFGLEPRFYEKYDIHLHLPAGGIPKDGPSAGITMAVALISALTKRATRRDVAMTGEITLRGRVLPIGGVKEKVLAAHRAGIKTFILPKRNMKDLNDVPREVINELHFVPVERMDDVIAVALHTSTLSKDEQEVMPVPMKTVKARRVITPKATTSRVGVNP